MVPVSEDVKLRLERLEQIVDIQAKIFDITWKHINETQHQLKSMQEIVDGVVKIFTEN